MGSMSSSIVRAGAEQVELMISGRHTALSPEPNRPEKGAA